MKRLIVITTLFSVMVVVAQSNVEEETVSTISQSFEGNWIWRSSKTPLGEGDDEVVELRENGDSWTISFTSIHHRFRNTRQASRKIVRGPFDAQIQDGILAYTENGEKRERTIRFENGRLVFPAIVQTDSRTWVFKAAVSRAGTGTRVFQFQCEFDPLKTPVGKATFPGVNWEGRQQFYVYEQGEYSQKTDSRPRRLKFLQRMKDGALHLNCELIWDQYGAPRFQGSSWYLFAEYRFEKLSDDELNRVKELTNQSSQPDNEEAGR